MRTSRRTSSVTTDLNFRSTIFRGALPGRNPGRAADRSSMSSSYFSLSRSSMAARSTVILTCFLHGPASEISTDCLSLPSSTAGVVASSGGGRVAVVSSAMG